MQHFPTNRKHSKCSEYELFLFFVELWEVVKHFKKYRKEFISLKNDLDLKSEEDFRYVCAHIYVSIYIYIALVEIMQFGSRDHCW